MADEDMPTQTFSMVVGYQKTDATLRNNGSVGIISGTQAERCAIALPYGDGVFSFDFGGFTDGSTRVSVSGLTKGNDIWIATTGARGMELWQNGTKVVSNAANPTRTATTGGFMLGNANGSASDLANWIFVHTYNVQLSTTDIATLTANPYAMYGAAATPITVTPPADSLAGGELA
jgi:hypothetical protein